MYRISATDANNLAFSFDQIGPANYLDYCFLHVDSIRGTPLPGNPNEGRKMQSINRREFIQGSFGAATASALFLPGRAYAASDRVVIGVMGLGGRGTYLAQCFAKRPDAEIAYLCDADTRRFARARNVVEEAQSAWGRLTAHKSPT
jgi:hypothetical protein